MPFKPACRDRRRFRSRAGDYLITKLVVALVCLIVIEPAWCQGLPLWEAAVGAFPSTFPAYRGSEHQQYYLFPFPYVVYRGKRLRADREGIRVRFFYSDRAEFNVSTNAAIPVRSDSDKNREGMPNLDPTIEIGPSLNIRVGELSPKNTVSVRLPVRAAIATDLKNAEQVGWVFHPHINLNHEHVWGGWSAGLNLGPLFATRKYHEYYYGVKPEFATPKRPAYRASGGYSGFVVLGSVSRRFKKVWAGGFLRYDYLGGAAFGDSPLVSTDHSIMAGFAVAWVFAQSSTTVPR